MNVNARAHSHVCDVVRCRTSFDWTWMMSKPSSTYRVLLISVSLQHLQLLLNRCTSLHRFPHLFLQFTFSANWAYMKSKESYFWYIFSMYPCVLFCRQDWSLWISV